MTSNVAPHGSLKTAKRPKGVSIAGMSTRPPLAPTAVTAWSVEATAKQVCQPLGASGASPPSPPSGCSAGRSSVRKVV